MTEVLDRPVAESVEETERGGYIVVVWCPYCIHALPAQRMSGCFRGEEHRLLRLDLDESSLDSSLAVFPSEAEAILAGVEFIGQNDWVYRIEEWRGDGE